MTILLDHDAIYGVLMAQFIVDPVDNIEKGIEL